jgi:hypothetical protein
MGHQNRVISPSYLIPKKIHTTNIETAEVIDIRNEAKNEGLVNKTSEENMRGKVASTSRQLKLIYYYFFF